MFNSMILGLSREIQDRIDISSCPIVKAFKNFYLDMFDLELDGWRGLGGTDADFVEWFEDVFPTGFLRRDLQKAKILFMIYLTLQKAMCHVCIYRQLIHMLYII